MALALNAAPEFELAEPPAARPAASLPPLREDLKLLPGASAADGSPTWTLHDPARHRFLRIGWLEFEILTRWGLGDAATVATAINAETTLHATEDDVVETVRFAHRAGLIAPRGPEAMGRLIAEQDAQRLSAARWLLKNYLFLKIRLINPDRILGAVLPYLGWMFTRGFLAALLGFAGLGLYLISRQWQAYTHSLLHLFSLEGALLPLADDA
jgi:putative peptide zinc metalloprotease protein